MTGPDEQPNRAAYGDRAADAARTESVSGDATRAIAPGPDRWWTADSVAVMRERLGNDVCRRLCIYPLPERFLLSVIIPVFNEARTVNSVIERVRATTIPVQLIIVDDGSDDGTSESLASYRDAADVDLIRHAKNRGKGAAIASALRVARGDVVVVQDADQEYDPQDFRRLMQPIVEGDADVVYGSRYGHFEGLVSPWWHQATNRFLSGLASVAIGIRLHDVETCYKMVRRESVMTIVDSLREARFGIEIELTAKLARQGLRFAERPIRYRPRWYGEGKKIRARDGLRALWCILIYGVLRR